LRSLPLDFDSTTEFGRYSVRFSAGNQEITIQKKFNIPVQIVLPTRYRAFLDFARQIDAAESGGIVIGFRITNVKNETSSVDPHHD
jgi:hypothetical protein